MLLKGSVQCTWNRHASKNDHHKRGGSKKNALINEKCIICLDELQRDYYTYQENILSSQYKAIHIVVVMAMRCSMFRFNILMTEYRLVFFTYRSIVWSTDQKWHLKVKNVLRHPLIRHCRDPVVSEKIVLIFQEGCYAWCDAQDVAW